MIYKCDMCGHEILTNEALDETPCPVCDEGVMLPVEDDEDD